MSGAAPTPASPTTTSLGHPRVHLRRTDSTNERARELATAGAPHGTLVSASEQTAGRGRQGRQWSAPAGSSVLMSLLLRVPPPLLPLIAAVAVCDVAGARAQVKWPNDIVIGGDGGGGGDSGSSGPTLAKLAGILAEGRPQQGWAVLGIGLNVAVRLDQLPAELQPEHRASSTGGLPAATLGMAPADVEPMLARLLQALERRLSEPAESTLEAWRARDALLGREIAWGAQTLDEHVGRGTAEGIDGTGRLIVALPDGGRTTIGAGEVHLRNIA